MVKMLPGLMSWSLMTLLNVSTLASNTFHSPTDSPRNPGGIQGIQEFRGESAGMSRNSGIPADSGGIQGGIHLQFTIIESVHTLCNYLFKGLSPLHFFLKFYYIHFNLFVIFQIHSLN